MVIHSRSPLSYFPDLPFREQALVLACSGIANMIVVSLILTYATCALVSILTHYQTHDGVFHERSASFSAALYPTTFLVSVMAWVLVEWAPRGRASSPPIKARNVHRDKENPFAHNAIQAAYDRNVKDAEEQLAAYVQRQIDDIAATYSSQKVVISADFYSVAPSAARIGKQCLGGLLGNLCSDLRVAYTLSRCDSVHDTSFTIVLEGPGC